MRFVLLFIVNNIIDSDLTGKSKPVLIKKFFYKKRYDFARLDMTRHANYFQ